MSTDLKRIVEAVLFAAETPLSLAQICQVLETKDKDPIQTALTELSREYDFLQRAFDLVEVAGGWRLRTRPEMAFWLRKLKKQSATRLSRASLETLAIIAYKQPVLKAEIERIRGVEVSGVLRMLMEKDLVRVVGRKDLPGRPLIYGTTRRFLEVFDLKDLSDLPTLEEMQELLGEPDLVREEDLDEAPLFTRGMAGRDDEADEDGAYGQYDGDEMAEPALPDEEDASFKGDEYSPHEDLSEQMAEGQADDVSLTEPEEAAAAAYGEQDLEQPEPEPLEQEPAPSVEQRDFEPHAEAEPYTEEMAQPVEQHPAVEPPHEPTREPEEQGVHHSEPKDEPEEPSGHSGPGGPDGDSGPRAA